MVLQLAEGASESSIGPPRHHREPRLRDDRPSRCLGLLCARGPSACLWELVGCAATVEHGAIGRHRTSYAFGGTVWSHDLLSLDIFLPMCFYSLADGFSGSN